jgi:hypothetical protein
MRLLLVPFIVITSIFLPLGKLNAQGEQHPTPELPTIEIKLTGPRSIGPTESLESQRFEARLTNRSAQSVVLFVRNGVLLNANWFWSITDAKGQSLGMASVEYLYCGTVPFDPNWRRLRASDVFTLGPRESREFRIPGPSDDYVFPYAGMYHFSVSLTYVPPDAAEYIDEQGNRQTAGAYGGWDLSDLSPDNLAVLHNSSSLQGKSDIWDMQMPSRRPVDTMPPIEIETIRPSIPSH